MLHYIHPQKIIEVGCGYSTLLTTEVVLKEMNIDAEITCIDPYPMLAKNLIDEKTCASINFIEDKVQNVNTNIFQQLNDGDLLFIDSTHVAKTGSDVLHEYFTIFPKLKHGVIIHIHDVFWPFEYLKPCDSNDWPAWNELYLLRALLTDNPNYEILFFNHYFGLMAKDIINDSYPLFLENSGGSLWLKKL